jgi:uncharacterized protein (TIGR00251 family)
VLDCHLQPGASRIGFAGLHGDRLKIRISAPPVNGKANSMLLAFLAKAFGVSKQQVMLVSGQTGRQNVLPSPRPGCCSMIWAYSAVEYCAKAVRSLD